VSSTCAKGSQQTNKKTVKGFKYKGAKSAEVYHGLAHRTVWCVTGQCPVHQELQLQTAHLREFWRPVRYNSSNCPVAHRTVRCASGATTTSCQRSPATAFNALQCAQLSGSRQKAHRTVYRTCLVHHRTVRCPRRQKLQRSESNGQVTWQAHRTVSGGAPDCLVRHATAAFTKRLVWWLGL
jgi:hypothetical protein